MDLPGRSKALHFLGTLLSPVRYHHPLITVEEAGSERLSSSPKVTQLNIVLPGLDPFPNPSHHALGSGLPLAHPSGGSIHHGPAENLLEGVSFRGSGQALIASVASWSLLCVPVKTTDTTHTEPGATACL